MMSLFLKKCWPTLVFTLCLSGLLTYTMMDAFVIARPMEDSVPTRDSSVVDPRPNRPAVTTSSTAGQKPAVSTPDTSGNGTEPAPTSSDAPGTAEPDPGTKPDPGTEPTPGTEPEPEPAYPIWGDMYYKDANIEISIEEKYLKNSFGLINRVFVADVKLSDAEYLRTALAKDTYGDKITETTSSMAERNNAVFAINGDYYGYRKSGWVLRNYHLYRATPTEIGSQKNNDEALLMFNDGYLMTVHEADYRAESLSHEVYQIFSFGPGLVQDGKVVVDPDQEVGQSAASNPRTVFGMVEPLHYIFILAEGRLVKNDGFTLYEIAQIAADCGCTFAYNLDGGSSSTMVFNGEVLNELPGNERKISDIIYFNGLTYTQEELQ